MKTQPTSHGISIRVLPPIAVTELRWLAGAVIVLLLVAQVPPTVERLLGPPNRVHIGTYMYVQDFSYYLSAMREGAASSSWLIHNPFTAEQHSAAFMYPLYVGVGKLAAATNVPPLSVYNVLETLGRVILPTSLYVFIAAFVPGVRLRRIAFILGMIGGGLAIWERSVEVIFNLPPLLGIKGAMEYITFTTMLLSPHLTLGFSALLLSIVFFAAAARGSRTALGLLFVSVAAISLLNSFSLPVTLATFGGYFVLRSVQERKLHTSSFLACLVAGVASAPFLVYNLAVFARDPFWAAVYLGLRVLSEPRPWDLPVDFGVVFLLAVVAVVAELRARRRDRATLGKEPAQGQARTEWERPFADRGLLLTWLLTIIVFSHAPVPYQNRFLLGLQPGLSVFAAYGLLIACEAAAAALQRHGLLESRARAMGHRLVSYPILILAAGTFLVVFASVNIAVATDAPSAQYRVDRDTYALAQWLAANTGRDDVILAAPGTSNVLAGMITGRVVAGHPVAINYDQKVITIGSLYRGEMSESEARSFLKANRTSYLVTGTEERVVGGSDPGVQLHLPVVMKIGQAIAYAIPRTELDRLR